jgi:PAS domain S-box-containing protein
MNTAQNLTNLSPDSPASSINLLEKLFNSLPYVFWKDLDGIYRGANINEAKAFGFSTLEGFIGKNIYEILTDEASAKLIDETDNQIMKDGKTVTLEETIQTPEGLKTFLSQKQPLYDDQGTIVGLLGYSMDITQIRAQEKLVREENEAYKAKEKSQKRITKFINKMLHEIQAFRLEELHEETGTKFQITDTDWQIKLTKREQQVLYFLSMNKSPKKIAQIISILEDKIVSDSTINAIVNKKLYPKFEVYNVDELVEKATILGLIPLLLDNSNH